MTTIPTAHRMTYRENVDAFGKVREVTAHAMRSGPRRHGATYIVRVDGTEVARVQWQGGRRYFVVDQVDVRTKGWNYITADNGSVADVARYVAIAWMHVNQP